VGGAVSSRKGSASSFFPCDGIHSLRICSLLPHYFRCRIYPQIAAFFLLGFLLEFPDIFFAFLLFLFYSLSYVVAYLFQHPFFPNTFCTPVMVPT
jgi:hypothetical protein